MIYPFIIFAAGKRTVCLMRGKWHWQLNASNKRCNRTWQLRVLGAANFPWKREQGAATPPWSSVVEESTGWFQIKSVSMFLKQIFQFMFRGKIALLNNFFFISVWQLNQTASFQCHRHCKLWPAIVRRKIHPVLSRCHYFSTPSHLNYLENNIQGQRSVGGKRTTAAGQLSR